MRKLLILLLMLCGSGRMYGQTIGIGDPCYEVLKTYIEYKMDRWKFSYKELLIGGPSYISGRLPIIIDSTEFVALSALSFDQIKKKIKTNENAITNKYTYSLEIFPYEFSGDSLRVGLNDYSLSYKRGRLVFSLSGGMVVIFVYDKDRQAYVVVDRKYNGI